MRISDWSSDVCSSDLPRCGIERWLHANGRRRTCATGSNTEDQPMAENKLVEARTVGIVGARGHTGAELIRLIAGHPRFELVFVSSRELDGQPVSAHVAEYEGSLRYANVPHESLGDFNVDACVLALPNGKSDACIEGLAGQGGDPVIVDLSADHRFDDDWYYGLPELTRDRDRKSTRLYSSHSSATLLPSYA